MNWESRIRGRETANPVRLLLAVLLFGLYPLHFSLNLGGGGAPGGINLSYGDLIVVLISLLWLVGLFKSRTLPRYFAFFSIFIVVAGLSFTINALMPAAYFDTMAFFIALLKLLGAVAWMVAVYILAQEFGLETIQYALIASVCIAAGLAIGGIYESFTTDILRPASTFNNPNLFGNYLLLHTFLALYLALSERIDPNRTLRTFLGVAAAVTSFGLLTTGSRGSIIGLVGVIGTSVLLLVYHGRASLRTIAIVAIGSILTPVTVLVSNPEIIERITGSQNVEVRLTMWETAADLFLANPILGIGFGQLSEAFEQELGSGIDPHNLYVLITAETGIIGAIVFFGLIAMIVRDSIEQSQRSVGAIFLAAGFVGLLLQGSVTDIDNFRSFWITTGLIAAHQAAIEKRSDRTFTTPIQVIRERTPETL